MPREQYLYVGGPGEGLLGLAAFRITPTGDLVPAKPFFRDMAIGTSWMGLDRTGKHLLTGGEPGDYSGFRLGQNKRPIGKYLSTIRIDGGGVKHPTRSFFYRREPDGIHQYHLNSNNRLTPLRPAVVPNSERYDALAMDPRGRVAYLLNRSRDRNEAGISPHRISHDGTLAPIPSSFHHAIVNNIVTHPLGKWIYDVGEGYYGGGPYYMGRISVLPDGRLGKPLPSLDASVRGMDLWSKPVFTSDRKYAFGVENLQPGGENPTEVKYNTLPKHVISKFAVSPDGKLRRAKMPYLDMQKYRELFAWERDAPALFVL